MKRIRQIREDLMLTQAQLARIIGETPASVSDRERRTNPTTRLALMALLYLKTLPRERLDALLSDPSKLED